MQRLLITAALLIGAITVSSAPAPGEKQSTPFLVARLQPAEKLLDDAKFLAGKFGSAETAEKFQAKILDYLGAESIADMGVEPKKHAGAYAVCVEDMIEPAFVMMLPVADESKILRYIGKFEVKAEKLEDSLYSLAIPDHPQPTFVRFANGYAYVTNSTRSVLAPTQLLAPVTAFGANEAGFASLTIRPDQISEPLRKLVLAHLSDTIKEVSAALDGDDEYPELSDAQTKSLIRWIEMICEGGRELTLHVVYDRASGDLAFDTTITPKEGSKLATSIAAVNAGSSLFTKMLGERGALNYSSNWNMDAAEAREFGVIIAESGAEALLEWLGVDDTDENSKAEVVTFCKSLVPTAEAGQIDVATTLRSVGERYIWLGATRLKDGKKVDDALRKMIAAIPEDKRNKFTLDAQTISEVKLHEIELDEEDEESEKLFGKSSRMWLAITENALVFGYGSDAAKAVAEAVNAISVAPAPNTQLDLSIKKLKTFLDVVAEGDSQELEKYFGKDADRVRLFNGTIAGGKSLQVRATISLQLMVGLILADEDEEAALVVPRGNSWPNALSMPMRGYRALGAGTGAPRWD